MTRPYRHCPDCRGSGWRKGRPVVHQFGDGTTKEYQVAAERCGCTVDAPAVTPAASPSKLDHAERAAGEREEEGP